MLKIKCFAESSPEMAQPSNKQTKSEGTETHRVL